MKELTALEKDKIDIFGMANTYIIQTIKVSNDFFEKLHKLKEYVYAMEQYIRNKFYNKNLSKLKEGKHK